MYSILLLVTKTTSKHLYFSVLIFEAESTVYFGILRHLSTVRNVVQIKYKVKLKFVSHLMKNIVRLNVVNHFKIMEM